MSLRLSSPFREETLAVSEKCAQLNWGLAVLLVAIAGIGVAALYAAGGGDFSMWAGQHAARFSVFFIGMIIVALIDIRWWYRLAYPVYGIGFVLLLIVEVMGHVGMGAQRWIDLGVIKLQPSELMKIAVILALARYFHHAGVEDVRRLFFLIPAGFLALAPVALVLFQPDMGTALMIVFASAGVFFVAGAPLWLFMAGGGLVLAALPVIWHFMHDYQKERVLTFLNPESDPLGAGYHIIQSKIALGSGGIHGRGFLEGTQSQLNFLPEKQTDFIFTLWAEEWGLMGGLLLLGLFGLVFLYGLIIAGRCRHSFGRLLAMGLSINFSLYVFINIAMVMGLIPVVGAPLPLVSYGGTAMMATLGGFGLMMSCNIHRNTKL